MPSLTLLDIAVGAGGLAFAYALYTGLRAPQRRTPNAKATPSSLPLPPGPPTLPLVGNLRDLPPPEAFEAEHWAKLAEAYGERSLFKSFRNQNLTSSSMHRHSGPISSISVFGQTIILLNDAQTAIDLLEKRSAIYSSRPRSVFCGEMYVLSLPHL